VTTLLLVHGGLWEAGMDADRFWSQPGIVAGLEKRGFDVLAPDRPRQAPDWTTEASHLASALPGRAEASYLVSAGPGRPVTVLAGSNGCSAATRLALDFPGAVAALLLAWPATAKDPAVDAHDRLRLAELGAPDEVIGALLEGQTLRGLTDEELAGLPMPVGVVPSALANAFHQRHSVDSLLRLVPGAVELPGCPESPRPEFPPYLESFVNAVAAFAEP
jgi:pimeloyl-ACP methyl ester carboxylesterase